MSQPASPIPNEFRVSKLLGRLARWSSENPLPVLTVTLLLTVAFSWLAASKLTFRTSRLDLLSPNSNYNQRWLRYLDKFGREDDAVIVVSGDDVGQVSAALENLGSRLSRDLRLTDVLYQRHLGTLPGKAMHLLPTSSISDVANLLSNCRQIVGSIESRGNIVPSLVENEDINHRRTGVVAASSVSIPSGLVEGLQRAQAGLDQLASRFPKHGELILEDQGRMGLCVVRMPHPDDDPQKSSEILRCLTEHLTKVRPEFPHVRFGLTGMPVLEWDESLASQRDMQRATYLSLFGVAIVFVTGFGSWRLPACAIGCLAISLIWTVGLTAVVVGHLNLFSIAFGAILAGLGIDYSIHVLTRLQSLVCDRPTIPLSDAIGTSVAQCGCGIVSGAATTAAAFIASVFTPFRGIAELGIITAIGVLVCMFVTIVVLPALVSWQSKIQLGSSNANEWLPKLATSRGPRWLNDFMGRVNQMAIARPRTSLLVGGIFTVACACFSFSIYYDHNLLNLQASDAPSVQTEHELIRRSGPSTWFAVSVANSPGRARQLREQFLTLPTVARVEEVGSLVEIPPDRSDRARLVEYCRVCADSLASQLNQTFSVQATPAQDATAVTQALYSPSAAGNSIPIALVSVLNKLSTTIAEMSVGEPPHTGDLPAPIQSRMVSHDQHAFLLRIFAKDDIWKRENLERFVQGLERIDPNVTGHPVQTYYASSELQKSFLHAGLYALLLVLALLMLDLGSIRLVLIAMIPVALGGLQMLGVLGWLSIPLNAANMIVLPLILGIGIDDGIHIVHEYKRDRRNFRLASASSVSILLTSATTMIGFGCIGLSDHRGLQSLGIVLVLGVGLCLANSILVLPPLLTLLSKAAALSSCQLNEATGEMQSSPAYLQQLGMTATATPRILSLPNVTQS